MSLTAIQASWLPANATMRGIRFVEPAGDELALVELPAPIRRKAILAEGDAIPQLTLITLPEDPPIVSELAERLREWCVSPSPEDGPLQLVTMSGAEIYWRLPRLAIVVAADRLPLVMPAVLEMVFLELELRGIEQELASLWPALEADAPLAFEVFDRHLRQRRLLAERFQQVILLRSRLAKITPRLLAPLAFPPTLATQIQERFRERLAVAHRLESLEVQLEMFERVYDGCGQRLSDYTLNKKGLTLEWIIIILLATQILLWVYEMLVKAS